MGLDLPRAAPRFPARHPLRIARKRVAWDRALKYQSRKELEAKCRVGRCICRIADRGLCNKSAVHKTVLVGFGKFNPAGMVLWVFGYGSLIWKAGFHYDERRVGYIKGYRRVFHQGSTDHRGTPAFPGRTVTLEPEEGHICWGVAYKVSGHEAEQIALSHLEVREKQYDTKAYVDFYSEESSTEPTIFGVLVYIASTDTKLNKNYLGSAPLEVMARQIIRAIGPSGSNVEYLFQLEAALREMGCADSHVTDLAEAVRKALRDKEGHTTLNGYINQ